MQVKQPQDNSKSNSPYADIDIEEGTDVEIEEGRGFTRLAAKEEFHFLNVPVDLWGDETTRVFHKLSIPNMLMTEPYIFPKTFKYMSFESFFLQEKALFPFIWDKNDSIRHKVFDEWNWLSLLDLSGVKTKVFKDIRNEMQQNAEEAASLIAKE